MEILKAIEQIRTPILNDFFSIITHLGGEIIAVACVIILYWCYNKEIGQRIAYGMIFSALTIQFVKITCRVERPWVRDKSFNPVKSAMSGATGYSFPSGHTGNITYFFATLASIFVKKTDNKDAKVSKKMKLKVVILAALLIIIVGFSRMYLGVHTLTDVLTAAIISLVIVFINEWLFDKVFCNKKNVILGTLFICAYAIAGYAYTSYLFNNNIIIYDYASDSAKVCGAAIGFVLAWFVETRYINFIEKGISFKMQLLKVVIGIVTTFGIKELIKIIGVTMFGELIIIDLLRYTFVIFWACGIYPIFIKKFFSPKNIEVKK